MELNENQIRQGDVFLERISEEVPDLTAYQKRRAVKPVKGRLVLAEGETTGHAHVVEAEGNVLVDIWRGYQELHVGGDQATLTHEEHTAHPIKEGMHRVTRQREYDPRRNRVVSD